MQNISRDCHRRVLPGKRHSGRTLYAKAQSEPYAREENIQQRAYLPLKRSSPRPQFYRNRNRGHGSPEQGDRSSSGHAERVSSLFTESLESVQNCVGRLWAFAAFFSSRARFLS